MSNRIKQIRAVVATRAEAEKTVGDICRLTLERNALQGDMDRELTEVRARYEGVIDSKKKEITNLTAHIESWAAANPDEFPAGRKSIELVHGRLGYRTGTPKLALLKGQKWDNVLGLLKSIFNGSYVRVKEEVARDEILSAATSGEVNDAQLRQLRIAVTQDESFFIEPNLQESDNRSTVEAVLA